MTRHIDSTELLGYLRRDLARYSPLPGFALTMGGPQQNFYSFCRDAVAALDRPHSPDAAAQILAQWKRLRARFVPTLTERLKPWNWWRVFLPPVPADLTLVDDSGHAVHADPLAEISAAFMPLTGPLPGGVTTTVTGRARTEIAAMLADQLVVETELGQIIREQGDIPHVAPDAGIMHDAGLAEDFQVFLVIDQIAGVERIFATRRAARAYLDAHPDSTSRRIAPAEVYGLADQGC